MIMLAPLSLLVLLNAAISLASSVSPVKRDNTAVPDEASPGYTGPDDPLVAGRRIRLQSQLGLCVETESWAGSTGSSVIEDCHEPEASAKRELWNFRRDTPGSIVRADNATFCLDGGDMTNGAKVKTEICQQGSPSQTWRWERTSSGENPNIRIRVGDDASTQCLDVDFSTYYGDNKPFDTQYYLQIWECHPFDTPDINQWFAVNQAT